MTKAGLTNKQLYHFRWTASLHVGASIAIPKRKELTQHLPFSGFRFAVTEIKAILFVLIRGFHFDLPTPKVEIEKKTS